MDPILIHATTGGSANFSRQQIAANNLANINTPGFKADLFQAELLTIKNEYSNMSAQTYVVQKANGINTTPGDIVHTGNDLDVAIDGDAWMVVKDSKGVEAYTRGGTLRLNAQGQLTTASGKPIMGNGGAIAIPPSRSIEIGSDGTISAVPIDGDGKALAVLDRIKLVKLDKTNIVKNEEGLLLLKKGSPTPADNSVKIVQHAIEGSNVNAIDQMVGMISSGRDFESQMKLLSTADDNAQRLAQLLQD